MPLINAPLSPAQWRRTINAAASASGLAAAGAVAWSLLPMTDVPPLPTTDRAALVERAPSATNVVATWASREELWSASLRGGFVTADHPVAVQSVASEPVAPPSVAQTIGIQLVGTILEAGRDVAIAIDRFGDVAYESVGGEFRLQPPGIRVDRIERDQITVAYRGNTVALHVGDSITLNSPADAPTAEPEREPMFAPELTQPTTPESPMIPGVDDLPAMSLEDELDFLNGL